MIQQVDITNFQSHKETSIEFAPGVNIIIGNSDAGKTAIMRALRWVIQNRPGGDAFRSNWGGETKVEIYTNNISVARIKDKTTVNEYRLSTMEDPFVAFGTDIPGEIKLALNMNEINIQSQFDMPFLLTATAGEVANHFNKIAHIDQIDAGLKLIQSWLRTIEQEIKARTNQIEEFKEQLTVYEDLDKFEMEVEVLEELEKKHLTTINSCNKLTKLITSIEMTEKEIDAKAYILKAEEDVNNILNIYTEMEDVKAKKGCLSVLLESINIVEKEIEENVDLLEDEELVNTLLGYYEEQEPIKLNKRNLTTLLEEIELNEVKYQRKVDRLNKQEETYKKELPPVCPLCNQKIKK